MDGNGHEEQDIKDRRRGGNTKALCIIILLILY